MRCVRRVLRRVLRAVCGVVCVLGCVVCVGERRAICYGGRRSCVCCIVLWVFVLFQLYVLVEPYELHVFFGLSVYIVCVLSGYKVLSVAHILHCRCVRICLCMERQCYRCCVRCMWHVHVVGWWC